MINKKNSEIAASNKKMHTEEKYEYTGRRVIVAKK